jgi:hypothetical protein
MVLDLAVSGLETDVVVAAAVSAARVGDDDGQWSGQLAGRYTVEEVKAGSSRPRLAATSTVMSICIGVSMAASPWL